MAICIPAQDNIPTNFVITLVNRLSECYKKGYEVILLVSATKPLAKARNELVTTAYAHKVDYIWFVDSDSIVPEGIIEELVKMDCEIASALYFTRNAPFKPVIRELRDGKLEVIENYERDKIIEVEGVGMGCCLIKKEVFEKIDEPFFLEEWNLPNPISEDLYFCRKARQAGFKIRVNTGLVIGHQGGIITELEFATLRNLKDKGDSCVVPIDQL